jgi:hypothetical protein
VATEVERVEHEPLASALGRVEAVQGEPRRHGLRRGLAHAGQQGENPIRDELQLQGSMHHISPAAR